MLKCKELVSIVSSNTENYSLIRKLQIKFHLIICHHCSAYVKQLQYLKNGFKKLTELSKVKQNSPEIQKIEDKIIRKINSKNS